MDKMTMPIFDCEFFDNGNFCWSPYKGTRFIPPYLMPEDKFNFADMELVYPYKLFTLKDLCWLLRCLYPTIDMPAWAFEEFTHTDIVELVMKKLGADESLFSVDAYRWFQNREFTPLSALATTGKFFYNDIVVATFAALKELYDTWEPLLSAERIKEMVDG